ncbi:MAG: SIS domain-containing protein [Syntrophales bacterium]|nr:SIS domain-containing protein [Syntrophales bacterium]
MTLKKFLKNSFSFLRECRIVVGHNPLRIGTPTLIIFPFLPNTLCCGFAGILTLHRAPAVSNGNSVNGDARQGSKLVEMFTCLSENDLNAVFFGGIAPASYLGGKDAQTQMERELLYLKGENGRQALFYDPAAVERMRRLCGTMQEFLAREERKLEEQAGRISTSDLEEINRGLIMLRDLLWALEKDVIDNVNKICAVAGIEDPILLPPAALYKYRKLNFLLNSLDRLEVRGRDSAGVQISFVPENNADLNGIMDVIRTKGLSAEWEKRTAAGDAVDGSICLTPPAGAGKATAVSFTYKTAEIIGELGRNVRELRKRIAGDALFHLFAGIPAAFETAFTHTRWASVGSITEENCHPIGNFTLPVNGAATVKEQDFPFYGKGLWTINVVLNGDIDNYQQLRESFSAQGGAIAPELTTDTKIIPLRIEHYLRGGYDLAEAFRLAVRDFEGSHAIALVSSLEPGKVFLALKGSGQSIYVGIAPDRYLFSSELYGLVEETPFFIKMDGEKVPPGGNEKGRGQIFILDQDTPGGAEGVTAFFYDKTPIRLKEEDIRRAEITTRDIDRGRHPHYFLKEIGESAHSVRKTLLGKYLIEKGKRGETAVFSLGDDVIPEEIREGLLSGKINIIYVIGHGTAAVAGSAIADALARHLQGSGITVQAMLASELSGFSLKQDLHDTLVIPITQSGTTTDTNRAVAMARERGAKIVAIVNRRQSDITMKADGVFYTSDGRDIEMAVASTKAFYSQIIAGNILALAIAALVSSISGEQAATELRTLETAPGLMGNVLGQRENIRKAVEKTINHKRYWAIVGSGPNKAAADEIRIKLSELCYLTISSDVVENKKHIDLSAEPLIIVCAAGSPESVIGDIAKDVAIFKAHKSSVVVFAEEGEKRFDAIADAVIPLPRAPLPLPVILNTLAGHLFGYYAACSIDEDALFLRAFKSRLNTVMVDQVKRKLSAYEGFTDEGLRGLVNNFTAEFLKKKQLGRFSQTGVGTISDLALLLKYAGGKLPLDDFRHDFPESELLSPVDLLDVTLGNAVDELSRPIDAIRHQAKTVTVGTSRKETLPEGPVSALLSQLSFGVQSLLSTNILLLERIQGAVSSVTGYTLYAIDKLDKAGKPGDETTIMIVKRGGVSLQMESRVEKTSALVGTKKGIVALQRIYAGLGRTDGAPLVIVPLLGNNERAENLLLLHVIFNENLSVKERLKIIGKRVNKLRDLIQECNLSWNDNLLADIPVGFLLGESAETIVGWITKNSNVCRKGKEIHEN